LLLFAVLLFVLLSGSAQGPGAVAFVNANVVDGTGAGAYTGTVVIANGRIVAAGADVKAPDGARIVDANGMTLMPGLFDLHTHLTASGAVLGVAADWPKNLMAYLYCGVTTVADLGEYQPNFEAVRKLLAERRIEGPRVAFATRFSTPGGHGAESGRPDAHTHQVQTEREARAAMAEVLRGPKPDLIKIFTDGWRYGTAADMTSMEQETLDAIVEEAHKAGIPVITHTVTVEKAKIAAKAGVDIIGHGLGDAEMDAELTDLLKTSGTRYAPTMAVYEPKAGRPHTPLLKDVLDPVFDAPGEGGGRVTPALKRRWGNLLANVALAKKAGIPLALGTDAGMSQTYHGWATLRELKLLVQGGLTPLEAIAAGTGVSAKALRVDADRGTIAVGKVADLVLIAGRPDRNIEDIENIRSVYLGGREVNRESLKSKIGTVGLSALPASAAPAKLDDFERADGRAMNGEIWVNYTDSGHDKSRILWTRGLRAAGNHTLLMQARMAQKERPSTEMTLPLAAGGMLPADAREYKGVTFEARGDGLYRVVVRTRGVRDNGWFAAPFEARESWGVVKVAFDQLARRGTRPPLKWSGDDVLAVGFEISRSPGETGWLEIDNVGFYR
jgi:imidazolonepropionase-like amidohydrolase